MTSQNCKGIILLKLSSEGLFIQLKKIVCCWITLICPTKQECATTWNNIKKHFFKINFGFIQYHSYATLMSFVAGRRAVLWVTVMVYFLAVFTTFFQSWVPNYHTLQQCDMSFDWRASLNVSTDFFMIYQIEKVFFCFKMIGRGKHS